MQISDTPTFMHLVLANLVIQLSITRLTTVGNWSCRQTPNQFMIGIRRWHGGIVRVVGVLYVFISTWLIGTIILRYGGNVSVRGGKSTKFRFSAKACDDENEIV